MRFVYLNYRNVTHLLNNSGNNFGESDETLAWRAASGQIECFETLVLRHRARVYGICYRMAGNPEDAEDWAQECFVRVYQQLGHYNPTLPFAPWLVRVASNTCLNLLGTRTRQRTQAPVGLSEELLDRVAGSEVQNPLYLVVERDEQSRRIEAIDELPPLLRQALVLRHQEELSFKEIADTLQIPLQTAATRVRRALLQVRTSLEKLERKEGAEKIK
jgi:RNA polymerase sigma-70 factor, ECF subfamily